MSNDLTSLVRTLAATTGSSTSDILDAATVLAENNPALPAPWSEEAIVRALPIIVEMAARSCTSVRAVAAATRATTVRPDEEPTT